MFKKILVPLDGSQLSERSLEPALALSQQTGGELVLARVPTADTLGFAVSEARQRELAHDARTYLETICKTNKQPQFSIRIQVLNGNVASAIVDAACTEQADLIIMSMHSCFGVTNRVHRSDRDGDAWPYRVEALDLWQRDCQSAAECKVIDVSRSTGRRRVELGHPTLRRIPC